LSPEWGIGAAPCTEVIESNHRVDEISLNVLKIYLNVDTMSKITLFG